MVLFSAETTPDVSVADAVAASISLPVVFRPQQIGAEIFVDGGIVSNLPAWPFDEERELDPDATTLAFEIADDGVGVDELGASNWLPAAIRTAWFGSGVLNLRAVGRSELIVLSTDLDVLRFDLGKPAALQQVAESTTAVDLELELRLFTRPALYRRACETIAEAVAGILDVIPTEGGVGPGRRRVRVSLAMPDEECTRSLRLRYGAGYGDDLEERLLLPIDASVAGAAWTSGEDRFEFLPFGSDRDLPGRANRYRKRQIWPEMQWALCIPIFGREAQADASPEFVVSVDCNERMIESAVAEFQDRVSTLVIDSFEKLPLELEEIGGPL